MGTGELGRFCCRSILLAAVSAGIFVTALLAGAPALGAQSIALDTPIGTASFDAVPAAITPATSKRFTTLATGSGTSLDAFREPEPPVATPIRYVSVERWPSRRAWMALSLAASGAAAFDAYSTNRSVASGNRELNPFMKPFAGSPAIYVALQATPLAIDYVGLKMQRSHNRALRRIWWLPQTTGAAMSVIAGAHNLQISR